MKGCLVPIPQSVIAGLDPAIQGPPRTALKAPGSSGQAHGCPVEFLWTGRMALILVHLERLATFRDSKGQRHAAQE
jgi:hypothetical protein